ncbi:MAG: hypothetical protein KAQ68_07280 [Clostridiales bacterium]|nr:hypothetical protein [Clostridiales bacterium]
MTTYVLGVDGGGTKTHYALYDTQGNKVAFLHGNRGNHESYETGYIGLENELTNSINKIMNDSNLTVSDISYAVVGLGGVDTKDQHRIISNILTRIGVKDFGLYNDGYLGIKAGSPNGTGICSINGTGTTCTGIDQKGNYIQVGGIGLISGDYAGASSIGTLVASKVYASMYQCGKPTIMKDMLFDELEIKESSEYADAISLKLENGEISLAELNKIAFLAANQKDKVAIDLLKFIGQQLGQSICGVIHNLEFNNDNPIYIIMAGSVYVKGENPTMIESMKSAIRSRIDNELSFTLLKVPPVTGAVLWALEGTGIDIDSDMREKVIANIV